MCPHTDHALSNSDTLALCGWVASGEMAHNRESDFRPNVRFGSKADMTLSNCDVRSYPKKADIDRRLWNVPLCQ